MTELEKVAERMALTGLGYRWFFDGVLFLLWAFICLIYLGVMRACFLPLTYFNNGLRDAMIYENPTSALYNSLIILAVASFFIIAASLLTKWREE
mgnify:CR=1 FL=1